MASKKKKNRRDVQHVLKNVDYYVDEIQKMLEAETYVPAEYRIKTIFDGASQKERKIFCPQFYPDQIIHWALILQIQKYLTESAYEYSCGSIPGKGGACGKKYLRKVLDNDKKHTKYCLKLDIRKFYPSIDQTALKTAFERKFKDRKLLRLIFLIIDSVDAGVPIGNYTSQWFANFFLTPLDHYIKEELQIKYYIRYMDDMVLLDSNKRKLHKARIAISEYLNARGAELKGNWQVFRVDKRDIDFLGYRFYRNKTTIRRRTALRIRRRVAKVHKRGRVRYADAAAVISYLGWIKNSDSHNYFVKYVAPYINIKKYKEIIRNESRKHNPPGGL